MAIFPFNEYNPASKALKKKRNGFAELVLTEDTPLSTVVLEAPIAYTYHGLGRGKGRVDCIIDDCQHCHAGNEQKVIIRMLVLNNNQPSLIPITDKLFKILKDKFSNPEEWIDRPIQITRTGTAVHTDYDIKVGQFKTFDPEQEKLNNGWVETFRKCEWANVVS